MKLHKLLFIYMFLLIYSIIIYAQHEATFIKPPNFIKKY
jgi:hypothetical protein